MLATTKMPTSFLISPLVSTCWFPPIIFQAIPSHPTIIPTYFFKLTRTGHVQTMATNEWGFTVLCMALTVVDDTSLVSKVIVAELKVGALCVYCVRVSAFMCKYRKKLP